MNLGLGNIRKVLFHGLVIVLVLIFLFPFYNMVIYSLRSLSDFFKLPPQLLPINLTLDNYVEIFRVREGAFIRSIFNSLFVASMFTMLSIFFCSLGGFGFSKYEFAGKRFLFGILLGTMTIPPLVLIVPLFKLMFNFGWINTYQSIILPGSASAFGVFWMRQYMGSIPDELLDQARIDGCNEFGIFFRIVLSISRPSLGALALFTFLTNYNAYLWPLIALRSEKMYTIPLFIQTFYASTVQGQWLPPYTLIMAASVIATMPVLIVFVALQKQFISGILSGSLKG